MERAKADPFRGIFQKPSIPPGFGCGGLLAVNRNESLQLLETATDSGITNFYTARMYGLGDAGGILGGLTRRHREHMIIASKVGILPPNRSYLQRLVNRGARLLLGIVPKAQKYVGTPDVWQPDSVSSDRLTCAEA